MSFDDTKRILIANGDNFYFTDDEGITLQVANGLDFLAGWGGNYLKRVIVTANKTIYLLATEGTGNWNAVGTIYKSTFLSYKKYLVFLNLNSLPLSVVIVLT